MRPTFEKTVDILVKAYLNDTLQHGNRYACAVGNIVASSIGTRVVNFNDNQWYTLRWSNDMPYPAKQAGIPLGWGAAFCSDLDHQKVEKAFLEVPQVKEQIDATGYNWRDLARIEKAFESVDKYEGDVMFNGLMAVVDVLAEIHGVDLTQREEAKLLFVK